MKVSQTYWETDEYRHPGVGSPSGWLRHQTPETYEKKLRAEERKLQAISDTIATLKREKQEIKARLDEREAELQAAKRKAKKAKKAKSFKEPSDE